MITALKILLLIALISICVIVGILLGKVACRPVEKHRHRPF